MYYICLIYILKRLNASLKLIIWKLKIPATFYDVNLQKKHVIYYNCLK